MMYFLFIFFLFGTKIVAQPCSINKDVADCNAHDIFLTISNPAGIRTVKVVIIIKPPDWISSNWKIYSNIENVEIIQDKVYRDSSCHNYKRFFENLFADDHLKNNLKSLKFSDVKMLRELPQTFKNYTKLEKIECYQTSLKTLSVYGLQSLSTLVFHGNDLGYLDQGGLSQLRNLRNLTIIDAAKLIIRQNAFSEISDTLKSLTLKNVGLTMDKLKNIDKLKILETLDLSNNNESFELSQGFRFNEQFPRLKSLNLSTNHQFRKVHKENFADMKYLQKLYLDETALKEFNIATLKDMINLKLVSARYTKKLETVKYDPYAFRNSMSKNAKFDLSYSSVGLLEETVSKWVECHEGTLVLSHCRTIDCSQDQMLKWMAYFHKKKSSFIHIDFASCNKNSSTIDEMLEKIYVDGRRITCKGTLSFNQFGNRIMLLLVGMIAFLKH